MIQYVSLQGMILNARDKTNSVDLDLDHWRTCQEPVAPASWPVAIPHPWDARGDFGAGCPIPHVDLIYFTHIIVLSLSLYILISIGST